MLELHKGDVQEAFLHLKGWYWAALETKTWPYHQTMERQTDKWVELYAKRDTHGAGFLKNGPPYGISNIH